MRMREGRIGVTGSAALTAAAMITNGLFALDPEYAYAEGNSAYIALPLSAAVSLAITLLLFRSMQKAGSKDLAEHITSRFGSIGGALVSLPLAAAFVICAAEPLIPFLRVLHRLVFDGVSCASILFFVFPVTFFAAWKGLETLSRSALIVLAVVLVSLAAACLAAVPDFASYRLYPIMGDGAGHFVKLTISETLAFLTPLTAAAVNMKGMQGARSAGRAALWAAILSAAVIGAVELALSAIYPYKVLAGLNMPLYRINFLSLSQSYLIRLDKLYVTVWLGGCMLSSAYMIYSAAHLYAAVFRQMDVTPAVASFSLLVLGLLFVSVKAVYSFLEKTHRAVVRFGWLLAAVPVAAAILFRKRRIKA